MKKCFLFFLILSFLLFFLSFFFQDIKFLTTFENITKTHYQWVLVYKENPFKIVIFFMLFNILMAMLPVPGISMISLLGGATFGFFPGLFYSSLATAIGNLGGFLIARYFLHDYVYERYGDKLRIFHADFQQDGIVALFSFRLFPFIPSFVANLIMGVTSLKWWSFFWVSWVGRIPMVIVYTWSGVQISKIKKAEDILNIELIFTFFFLASLPWIIQYMMKLNKK